MLGSIGPLEIAIVLVIALMVFGPKRLPELASSLGRGLRELKESMGGERGSEDPKPIDPAVEADPADDKAG